jgi:hypothetical protein
LRIGKNNGASPVCPRILGHGQIQRQAIDTHTFRKLPKASPRRKIADAMSGSTDFNRADIFGGNRIARTCARVFPENDSYSFFLYGL